MNREDGVGRSVPVLKPIPLKAAPHLNHSGRDAEPTESAAALEGTLGEFENELDALHEDRLRARRMRRVLNQPGRTNWLNIKDRLWLANQRLSGVQCPPLDREAVRSLAERLEAGVASRFAPFALASWKLKSHETAQEKAKW